MPQRFLRPGITNSQRWNAVDAMSGNLFIRLLTLVDDFGRTDGRTSVIFGQCFAVWNELHPAGAVKLQQLAGMLQQLAGVELIDIYEVDGKRVLQISQWQERIREGCKPKWAEKTGLAATCSNLLPSPSSPTPAPLCHRPNAIASTQLRWSEAEGWSGKTEELVLELKAAYPACDIDRQFLEMAQWLKANPKKAKKTAWRRFVDNWLRRKQDRGGDTPSANVNGARPRILSFDEKAKRKSAIQAELNEGSRAAPKDRDGRSVYGTDEKKRRDALYREMEEL